MKIVCDSCSTKYSISDDKVRGKVFKIRCKKCSHIIVVKGTADAAPAVSETPSDAVWHLVVDGDQVGPLSDADVRARLSRNEISPENYVWKEGFSDWLRLAEIPEFASGTASAPVAGELFSDSDRADATDVGERIGGVGGLFGGEGAVSRDSAHSGGHVALSAGSARGLSGRHRQSVGDAAAEEDAFSAMPAAGGSAPLAEGADLFGAVAPRADSGHIRPRGVNGTSAGRHDGGRVENLTAQRSDNSVLFSLSNLQSLAAPAPAAKPGTVQTTEGSGLIDIRAMAASTMRGPGGGGLVSFGGEARTAGDDLPAFGAFSSAAPVLLPVMSSSGPPKWVYALVAMAAVMILAVGAATFSILGKPVVVEQPAPPPVAAVPEAKPKPAPKAVEDQAPGSKAIAAADLPPRENGEPAAEKAGDKAEKAGKVLKKFKGSRRAGLGGDAKAGGGSAMAAAGSAAPPVDIEKAKPAKGSLDDLLDGALNGRKKPRVEDDASGGRKVADSGGGAGPLAKAAVVAGMNGVKGKVSACYAQFKVPGLAMVNVVIAKSGKVSSSTVTGKFAGTPTGTCVESAVKTASFPPSEGLSTPYPFSLR
jgi:predicted Zn finger-like uncharacterized protein